MGLELFQGIQDMNTLGPQVGTGAEMFQVMKCQNRLVRLPRVQACLEGLKVFHVMEDFHKTKLLAGTGLGTNHERIFLVQIQAHF